MSDVPFGFRDDDDPRDNPGDDPRDNPGDDPRDNPRDDDPREDAPTDGGVPAQRPGDEPNTAANPDDPLTQLFGALGGGGAGGMPDLGAMLQQLGRMLSWQGGPVNWDLANQSARQVVAAAGDRSVSAVDRRTVEDAFRLADTWLDDATSFPATGRSPRTWSRAEWVEGTQGAWRALVEPVAARVSEAMSKALPAEVAQAAGPLVSMMQQVGVSMWGAQVGQGIGQLAGEVFGSADVGLPLADHPALLPANVRAFGEGLGLDERDVSLYLALREAAHLRLFAHAPWLRSHLMSLVEDYARHVSVDTDRIESSLREIDPQRPEAIQEALEGGLFDLPTTPEQKTALERLELALALVEGWVDDVVTQATGERLPSAPALREMVRRRRATGGPAEQTFATLVGLELRPRRLREASAFWTAVRDARGVDGRDSVWAHPDLMPSTDDLTDPDAYLSRDELDTSSLDDSGPATPGPADSGALAPEHGNPAAPEDGGPAARDE